MWRKKSLFILVVLLTLFAASGFLNNSVFAEPSLSIDSPKDGAELEGKIVRISGSYHEVTNIQLIINASDTVQVQSEAANDQSGTWYYDLDTSKYDGNVEILATGTNTATRYTIWSNRINITINNPRSSRPEVIIKNPKDGEQLTRNSRLDIDVESENSIRKVEIRINGSRWLPVREKYRNRRFEWRSNFMKGLWKDQTISLEARATDVYGNTGYSMTTYVDIGKGSDETTEFVKQDRAMWIWENASYNLLYNKGSRTVLDAMAKDTKTFGQDPVTTLYLGVDRYFGVDMLEDEREKVRDLVSWAHEKGYKIQALIAGGTTPLSLAPMNNTTSLLSKNSKIS
ncbi:hypothetical protein MUN89_20285 [Halobacillus salinarum]|uniref:Uncharacterized protein n=1 Tax=Halobacillus salinarum TaxID=2932257 RepID=A0ABY4EJL8_9BACI|nr:hypothetical protein [Halobacillus salinarum]UOQ44165.1 hypothetical protein MUN89_20285 [Halobacillus salinarum]